MINLLVNLRCKLEGLIFNNVKIDIKSRFNRRYMLSGIKNIKGKIDYPVRIIKSSLHGNVSVEYGTWIINSLLNTGNSGAISIGRFSSIIGVEVNIGESRFIVGDFCSIASGTRFLSTGHNMDRPSTYYIFKNIYKEYNTGETFNKGDVILEDDVWIGTNSIILGGVKIGRGAVIAAGSVVTKNVLPYSIVGGNPARLIKMRFSNEIIEVLENLEWWNWNIETIKKRRLFFETNFNTVDDYKDLSRLNQ